MPLLRRFSLFREWAYPSHNVALCHFCKVRNLSRTNGKRGMQRSPRVWQTERHSCVRLESPWPSPRV